MNRSQKERADVFDDVSFLQVGNIVGNLVTTRQCLDLCAIREEPDNVIHTDILKD